MSITKKFHEFSNWLPKITGDNYEALKQSIERNGVLDSTVWYEDKILDGRHREMICEELNREGKFRTQLAKDEVTGETVEERVPYECKRIFFEGTELEALAFVEAKSMARRDMTSSQKAMAAVLFLLGNRRFGRKAREAKQEVPSDIAELLDMPKEGDIAAWLARRAGTNRRYIFHALKVSEAKGAKALTARVMSGELSLKVAADEIAAAMEAEGSGEGEADMEPVVLDALRKAVPPEYVDAFGTVGEFQEVDQILRGLLTRVENLVKGPGGAYLTESELKSFVNTLRTNLKANRPHTVCPKCEGGKTDPNNKRKACPLCHRTGWVSKLTYQTWEREQGRAAEAEASEEDVPDAVVV